MTTALLRRLEASYDAIPRDAGSHAEDVGPLVVFHSSRPLSPSYARPGPAPAGAPVSVAPFTVADVDAARARKRELGVTETLEWIDEVAPSLEAAAITSGFRVERCPLMVLDPARLPLEPSNGVRLLNPAFGDFALSIAASWAVAELAFGGGDCGPTERDHMIAAADPARAVAAAHAHAVGRMRVAVVEVPGAGVVASGLWHSGRGAAEIVAVATLSSCSSQRRTTAPQRPTPASASSTSDPPGSPIGEGEVTQHHWCALQSRQLLGQRHAASLAVIERN